jgi:hypothetical protein
MALWEVVEPLGGGAYGKEVRSWGMPLKEVLGHPASPLMLSLLSG